MNYMVVQAVLRHLLTFIGGVLVALGYMDSDTVNTVIGAVTTVVGAIFSAVNKVDVVQAVSLARAEMPPGTAKPQVIPPKPPAGA